MKYLPMVVFSLSVIGVLLCISMGNYLAAIWAFTSAVQAFNLGLKEGVF